MKTWSEEEFILTLSVYFQLPFGRLHHRTPEVIELAKLLDDRSANSAAMRLSNFASCDPAIFDTIGPNGKKRVGLPGGKSQCQPYWDKYANNKELLFEEAARIKAKRLNQSIEDTLSEAAKEGLDDFTGESRSQEVNVRINQDAFRNMVLNNYENKCAVTGIDIPELLVASHIIPWADKKETRLDPENGICLSSLYDKAFDRGLIGIDKNYRILISNKLQQKVTRDYYNDFFAPIDGKKIILPYDHKPNKEFLEYHLDVIFEKQQNVII